jgi:hypothetical protein
VEAPFDAEVESKKRVVFPLGVPAKVHAIYKARRGCNRLSRMRLHPHVGLKSPRQIGDGIKVKFVPFIAIRVPILRSQIK